jgi:hypothetical protein
MVCTSLLRQLIKESEHMRIYDGSGALTIFGLRIGATSCGLGCDLCRGSVRRQGKLYK